jgi:hypothetical protein
VKVAEAASGAVRQKAFTRLQMDCDLRVSRLLRNPYKWRRMITLLCDELNGDPAQSARSMDGHRIKTSVRAPGACGFWRVSGKRFLLTPNSAKHPLDVSLRTFDQRRSLCPRRHEKSRSRSLGDNQLKYSGEPIENTLSQ